MTDCVLQAVGRSPNTGNLDLTNTDVQLYSSGAVVVDEFEDTKVKTIHALGDVTGKVNLTPVAVKAGRILSERLFNGKHHLKMDYENIPSVIFSHPPLGSIGLSEENAIKKYGEGNVNIYKTEFKNMHYSLTTDANLK